MRKGTTPAYRHHKASGQAAVVIKGKWHYLGVYDSPESLVAYREVLREHQVIAKADADRSKYPSTCNQLVLAFLRHAKTYYVKNGKITAEYYAFKAASRFVSALFGDSLACEFGPKKLKACREAMIDGTFTRKQKPYSRKFINKTCGRIRHMFKWAVAEEFISSEVHQGLQSVSPLLAGRTKAIERPPVGTVEQSIIDATIFELRPMVADMVRIQQLTGMRPGEICGMRKSEIETSERVWRYAPTDHKMQHRGRKRWIAIGPRAQRILKKYLEQEIVFMGERGAQMTAQGYRDAIHRGCGKAGVDNWNPNQLRHNAATKFATKYGLETARASLSHSDNHVTKRYAQHDFELAKIAAAEIG